MTALLFWASVVFWAIFQSWFWKKAIWLGKFCPIFIYFIGTMIGFIGFGELPELGKKVKTFSALAPVATVGHIEGAMKVLSYFKGEVEVKFSYIPNAQCSNFPTVVLI